MKRKYVAIDRGVIHLLGGSFYLSDARDIYHQLGIAIAKVEAHMGLPEESIRSVHNITAANAAEIMKEEECG